MTAQADQESYSFQAEVVQILDLMIHSLYSNKEIFLRELISNVVRRHRPAAAGADGPGRDPGGGPWEIRVSFDPEARTITIADHGIGMSRDEVIEHIGTIAKSGTREFLHALTRDQQEGRLADRPVRGGVRPSLGLHRGRPGRAHHPAGRSGRGRRGALGVRRGGATTLQTTEWTERGPSAAPAGRQTTCSEYRLNSIIGENSDHISLPIFLGDGGRRRKGESSRPGDGAVDAVQERDHRRRVPGLLQAHQTATSATRWPGCTARSRAPSSTRCSCSSRAARPTTCGSPTPGAGSSCTSGGCSSWRTRAAS